MKMNIKKTLAAMITVIIMGMILSSCSTDAYMKESAEEDCISSMPVYPVETEDTEEMFTNRDSDSTYDIESGVEIKLNDEYGSYTINKEGTYIITGFLSDGQIIVDADKQAKIQIVLNGVEISSCTSAALYIKQADKVFVTVNEGTINSLSNAEGFIQMDDNNINGAVFSKEDITFNGYGILNVKSPYGNGIVSKDDLVLSSGTYNITAGNHGIEAKDCVKISSVKITVASSKDGIHAENEKETDLGYIYIKSGELNIESGTDGISASGFILIDDGVFDITTGGGSANSSTDTNGGFNQQWGMLDREVTDISDTDSAKGIKSAQYLVINNASMSLDTSDDSLHSDTIIMINNGVFKISSGDDGMHADTQLVINSGTIDILKSYEGIESQSIDITGGTVIVTASDDGFNSAGGNDQSALGGRPGMGMFTAESDCYINISGGYIEIDSKGDGIDSNGDVNISGGQTYISGPTDNGNGAFDYNGAAIITGGTIIAAGSSGMAQNFSNQSSQGAILINMQNSQSADSVITIKDEEGNLLVSFSPSKQYSSAVISSPGITDSGEYQVDLGSYSIKIIMTSYIYSNSAGMNRSPGQFRP